LATVYTAVLGGIITNDSTLSLVVAAAAGAFLYHLYAKVSILEAQVSEGGNVISLSSLLDMAKGKEEDEEEVPVGFSNKAGKIRRKNV
jgi:hypothetical protein